MRKLFFVIAWLVSFCAGAYAQSGENALLGNLAAMAYSRGDYSSALKYLTMIGEEGGADVLNTRASLLQRLGRTDEAEKTFLRAMEKARGSQEEAAIQLNLATLQLEKKPLQTPPLTHTVRCSRP